MTDNWWCNPHLRGVKRQLSVLEKASLPTHEGRALVLPGEPPTRRGERGEIDELITAGYDPARIFGVEQDGKRAEELYRHFYDICPIHWEEVGEFLRLCRGTFSYIHLDFAQQFKPEEFETTQCWIGKVDPVARVRISILLQRRMQAQLEWEAALGRIMLRPLLASLIETAPEQKQTWLDHETQLGESEDITTSLGLVFLYNFFFGIDPRYYADIVTEQGPQLPKVAGQHILRNIRRYHYREAGGHHDIGTIWADVIPQPLDTYRDQNWIHTEVHQVLSSLEEPLGWFIPSPNQEAKHGSN